MTARRTAPAAAPLAAIDRAAHIRLSDAILLELDTEVERYDSLIESTAEDFADDDDGGEEMAGMFEGDQADIRALRDAFAAGDFDAVRSTILDTNPREMLAENCPTFAAWFARTRTPDQHLF